MSTAPQVQMTSDVVSPVISSSASTPESKRPPAIIAITAALWLWVSSPSSFSCCLGIPKFVRKAANAWPRSGFVKPSATSSDPRRCSKLQVPPGALPSRASRRYDARIFRWRVLHDELLVPWARPIAATLSP